MDEANGFLGPDAARTGSPCFLAVAGIVTLELLPRQIVFLEIE